MKLLRLSKCKLATITVISSFAAYYNRDTLLNKLSTKYKLKEKYLAHNKQRIHQTQQAHSLILNYINNIQGSIYIDPNNITSDPHSLEMSPEINEYRLSSQSKLQSIYNRVIEYDNKLKTLTTNRTNNKTELASLTEQNDALINQIKQHQTDLQHKSASLLTKITELNKEREQLMTIINNDYTKYKQQCDSFLKDIHSYTTPNNANKSLSNIALPPNAHIDINSPSLSKESIINAISLLKQSKTKRISSYLSNISAHFLDQTNAINTCLSNLNSHLHQHDHLTKTYLEFSHDYFDMQNKHLSLSTALSQYNANHNSHLTSKLNEYKEQHKTTFLTKTYAQFIKEVQVLREDILKMNLSATKDELLKIQNNFPFIKNSFLSRNVDLLIALKYYTHKPNTTLYKDIVLKLKQLSLMYNDEFTYDTLNKSKLSETTPYGYADIVKEFDTLKKKVITSLLWGTKVNMMKVYGASLYVLCGDVLMSMFHPRWSGVRGDDKESVKIIKALSYMKYYLKREKYDYVLSYLKHLNDYSQDTKTLEHMLQCKIKSGVVVDLLEKHFI